MPQDRALSEILINQQFKLRFSDPMPFLGPVTGFRVQTADCRNGVWYVVIITRPTPEDCFHSPLVTHNIAAAMTKSKSLSMSTDKPQFPATHSTPAHLYL
jgi:hypothetical protein